MISYDENFREIKIRSGSLAAFGEDIASAQLSEVELIKSE